MHSTIAIAIGNSLNPYPYIHTFHAPHAFQLLAKVSVLKTNCASWARRIGRWREPAEDVHIQQRQQLLKNTCIEFNNFWHLQYYIKVHIPYLHFVLCKRKRASGTEEKGQGTGWHDWKTFNTSKSEIYKVFAWRFSKICCTGQKKKDIEINFIRVRQPNRRKWK